MALISVMIGAYNRNRNLRETLESLAVQHVKGFNYELIVVDRKCPPRMGGHSIGNNEAKSCVNSTALALDNTDINFLVR